MEELSPADFEGVRLKRKEDYAVAFSAEWCPYSRAFMLKFAAREGTVPVRFGRADITDTENPLWERFEVEVVPTVVGFHSGSVRWRADGRLARGLTDGDLDKMAAWAAGERP